MACRSTSWTSSDAAGVALITDSFSAHQEVEDDDMNVMCLGAVSSDLLWRGI